VATSYNGHETPALTDGHHHQQQTSFCPHPADLTVPPAWQGRSIAGPKLRLVNMTAFVELPVLPNIFTANAVRITVWIVVDVLMLQKLEGTLSRVRSYTDEWWRHLANVDELLFQYTRFKYAKWTYWLCDLDLCPLNPKTVPVLGYPKVIPYTKFEHFGIIRFWVMLRTNKQTNKRTNKRTRKSYPRRPT